MIHLVYVKGEGISTPYAITNELSRRLASRYEVTVYDWDERGTIIPAPGDVLIGHPYPNLGRVFRNSFFQPGWAKRIVLSPFAHAMPSYIAFLDEMVCEADCYLAICADYWMDTISESLFSHWAPKMRKVDLAVRRDHYPFIKQSFSPIGQRRFLYIGRLADYKGIDFLVALAESNPELHFGWIGYGSSPSKAIEAHGERDLSSQESRDLIASYDYMITCGRADPNPTTILESASWGLIPVCTKQSGYSTGDWFVNIPLDDIPGASRILSELNQLDEAKLREYQRRADRALTAHYSWDRFYNDIVLAIEAQDVATIPDDERTVANKRVIAKICRVQRRRQLIADTKLAVLKLLSRVKRLVLGGGKKP